MQNLLQKRKVHLIIQTNKLRLFTHQKKKKKLPIAVRIIQNPQVQALDKMKGFLIFLNVVISLCFIA